MEQLVRGGAPAARGARLPRLHPSEDDPGGQPRAAGRRPDATPTGCRSTSSCRPRTGLTRLAPEKRSRTIRSAMGGCGWASTRRRREPKAPRFAPAGQSTQLIVGADEADDGAILGTVAGALCRLPAEAGLLLRLQPDPGGERSACRPRPAAAARAPAVPGRLADALLRLRGRGDRWPARRTACWTSRSTPSLPGRWPPRPLPGRRQQAEREPAAARARPGRADGGPHRRGAPLHMRCGWTTWPG